MYPRQDKVLTHRARAIIKGRSLRNGGGARKSMRRHHAHLSGREEDWTALGGRPLQASRLAFAKRCSLIIFASLDP